MDGQADLGAMERVLPAMLAAGIAATIVGLVMLRRFSARYPVIDGP